MFQSVFNLITQGITWGFNLLRDILTSTGMYAVFLGVFACFTIVRFIIMPLMGGRGISSSKKGEKNE